MKPEDLTPEKLKELEPYLSSNSENSLYEYLDIFDKNILDFIVNQLNQNWMNLRSG